MPANPARLYQQLQNTGVQNKDTPMYQFLRSLIDSIQGQFLIEENRSSPIIPDDISDQPFLTHQDAVADLPNSRELLPGDAIEFDDAVANERTVNVKVDGTTVTVNPSNELEAIIPTPPPDQGYVVLSDGATGGSSTTAGAKVYFDTNITITDSVETIIDWTDETIDDDNFWEVGNPSRLTVPADGWYIIRGQLTIIALSAGQIALAIIVDGTTEVARVDNFFTPVNTSTQVSIHMYLTAGQYVELEALIASSDPTTDALAGEDSSWFEILAPGTASIAPSPINDGFGNFIYVPYTP